jgi:hypothetical protein
MIEEEHESEEALTVRAMALNGITAFRRTITSWTAIATPRSPTPWPRLGGARHKGCAVEPSPRFYPAAGGFSSSSKYRNTSG